MSHTEAPYSMTFKTGKGNLFTVRGATADELAANLAMASVPVATEDGPTSVLDMISEIERHLTGVPFSGGQQAAQAPQGSLSPVCPDCKGPTTEKGGTGKRGPWRAYFCVNGTGHTVIDAETGKPWPKRS